MTGIVGCEESQAVAKAFRARGHEFYSCDLQECSGGKPEWHIKDDIRNVIFKRNWDIVIGHPTCTRLANSGVLRLYVNGKKGNGIDPVKWKEMQDAAEFFKLLWQINCPRVCIENPIPHGYALDIIGDKYSQIIQPWQFGHPESKATCLWLKGLPLLKHTNILTKPVCGHWDNQTPSGQNKLPPDKRGQEGKRAKERSKTYAGIAEAMADQWGSLDKIIHPKLTLF